MGMNILGHQPPCMAPYSVQGQAYYPFLLIFLLSFQIQIHDLNKNTVHSHYNFLVLVCLSLKHQENFSCLSQI